MLARLDDRCSLASPLSCKARKLFGGGGSVAPSPSPSPDLTAAAGAARRKPRSATISIIPGPKKIYLPNLSSGWFNNRCYDAGSILSRRRKSHAKPPSDHISPDVETTQSETITTVPSPQPPQVSVADAQTRQSAAQQESLEEQQEQDQQQQQQQQQQREKVRRRKRSFFFKKRKGCAGAEVEEASTTVDLPPLPSTVTIARPPPVMSATQLEARRLQDEQNLAVLERVSDLVCQAVLGAGDLVTPPRHAEARRRLASPGCASLASPRFSDSEGGGGGGGGGSSSYTQASDGGWPSDASESVYQRTPPDQSVLDQVLLPSSMKSLRRECRKQRPTTLSLGADSHLLSVSPTSLTARRIATNDDDNDGDVDFFLGGGRGGGCITTTSWMHGGMQGGPAPPPRPGRSSSQRLRTVSLSMPRTVTMEAAAATAAPMPSPHGSASYRSQLSTIQSNSSSEELSPSLYSPRSRASFGDIDSRPSTRHGDVPFSTLTFDSVWTSFP